MALQLGDVAPDFVAESTAGMIRFHEWKRDRWALLFSHPEDFTPVCTTEIGAAAALKPEFDKRATRLLAVSVDPLDSHYRWLRDVQDVAGCAVEFPIVADPNRWIASLYGMIPPHSTRRQTARVAFIIGPDDRIRLIVAYPPSTGRNFRELLRALDSIQLAERYGVATPANWEAGEDVIIPTGLSGEEAAARVPKGFVARKPYLRVTPDPTR
jgi:alkyl hydroperoxide reductase subunit AhpC